MLGQQHSIVVRAKGFENPRHSHLLHNKDSHGGRRVRSVSVYFMCCNDSRVEGNSHGLYTGLVCVVVEYTHSRNHRSLVRTSARVRNPYQNQQSPQTLSKHWYPLMFSIVGCRSSIRSNTNRVRPSTSTSNVSARRVE